MACESDDVEQNFDNVKAAVRKSFARMYAALKARELTTLRQLDAIVKQCQDHKEFKRKCVQNIHISYDNESTLVECINNYGLIDLEKLNFDNHTFTLEDYVSPNDDHMYSYKTIEEITKEEDVGDILAIEEAAIKQITGTEDCVCCVNIRSEEVSKKFRELESKPLANKTLCINVVKTPMDNDVVVCSENIREEETSDSSESEVVKIDPTDDWLNTIKTHTETEPTQVTDVMEYSTIACS